MVQVSRAPGGQQHNMCGDLIVQVSRHHEDNNICGESPHILLIVLIVSIVCLNHHITHMYAAAVDGSQISSSVL